MAAHQCPNCGLSSESVEAFCRRCGARLTSSGPQSFEQPANREGAGFSPNDPAHEGGPQSPGAPIGGGQYSQATGGVWRQGSVLVFQKYANLPDRCLKCNAPAQGVRLTKTLAWHHPALYLLIFGGLLTYLVVAFLIRKTANVSLGLCEHHMRQRRTILILNWSLFAAGLLAFVLAIAQESGMLALAGVVLVLAGATAGTILNRYVNLKRIDDSYVWLRGVSPDYLAELPQVP